jgi:hypothetical protein
MRPVAAKARHRAELLQAVKRAPGAEHPLPGVARRAISPRLAAAPGLAHQAPALPEAVHWVLVPLEAVPLEAALPARARLARVRAPTAPQAVVHPAADRPPAAKGRSDKRSGVALISAEIKPM